MKHLKKEIEVQPTNLINCDISDVKIYNKFNETK